jgi:hypothetical protein
VKRPKPLARFDKIELHHATFHPFESTKYLNINALKKVPIAKIELGSIEGGGVETTLVATIQDGKITRLAPATCKGCAEKSNTKPKAKKSEPSAALKKSVRAALTYMKEKGLNPVKLPIPVTSKALLEIEIGPIIIGPVIIDIWPPDICIVLDEPDGSWCTYCLWGPKLCGGGKL